MILHNFSVAMVAIHQADFQLVKHPAYTPDLDPIGYRLFSKLKKHLRERKCSSDNDDMSAANESLKRLKKIPSLMLLKWWIITEISTGCNIFFIKVRIHNENVS